MSIVPTSPLTGAAQTGFTNPTFTLVEDEAGKPSANSKQWIISALGGTQPASVDVHSVSRPFTLTFVRPKAFKVLGIPNPTTGVVSQVPMNVWKVIARKGVTPLSGQASKVLPIQLQIAVPAGADEDDDDNIRAVLSMLFGALNDVSSDLGDSLISGVL